MLVTTGRILIYRLTKDDAAQINRRRTNPASILERIQSALWPIGAQAHIGNSVSVGEAFPPAGDQGGRLVREWPSFVGWERRVLGAVKD